MRESVRGLDNHPQAEAGIFTRGGLLRFADGPLRLGDEGRLCATRFSGWFRFVFGCDHKLQVQSAMPPGLASGRLTWADCLPH
jgi:hypothetical protein